MATLWNRASGPQYRMLKIVAGAVMNAAHAHPGRQIDERFARSVSKRAVGTISAQWVELLAAPSAAPSGAGRDKLKNALRRKAQLRRLCKRGPAKGYNSWPPLAFAVKRIAGEAGRARRDGNLERERAMVEMLRIIKRAVLAEMSV